MIFTDMRIKVVIGVFVETPITNATTTAYDFPNFG